MQLLDRVVLFYFLHVPVIPNPAFPLSSHFYEMQQPLNQKYSQINNTIREKQSNLPVAQFSISSLNGPSNFAAAQKLDSEKHKFIGVAWLVTWLPWEQQHGSFLVSACGYLRLNIMQSHILEVQFHGHYDLAYQLTVTYRGSSHFPFPVSPLTFLQLLLSLIYLASVFVPRFSFTD